MLIIFLDSQGIVHKEIVPEGRTENTEFYKRVMDLLLMCIQLVRPAAFWYQNLFLLHDNTPTHKAAIVCKFLAPKYVTNFCHLLNSPDLSLSDSFLFPKLKMNVRELHFSDDAEIQEAVTDELRKVQKRLIFGSFSETIRVRSNESPPEVHSTGSSSCVMLSRSFLVPWNCACPQSCKCLLIFDPKNVTAFHHLPYCKIYLRQTIFSFLSWKWS